MSVPRTKATVKPVRFQLLHEKKRVPENHAFHGLGNIFGVSFFCVCIERVGSLTVCSCAFGDIPSGKHL